MSSIIHATPSRPSRVCCIFFWKCSGADEIPKGKRLKQCLPNGVMNVVRALDSCVSGICQNPELASNLLNTVESFNCASVSSTAGRICHSRFTDSFSFVRSTQILIFKLGLGTTTMPVHQSVGLSTREMTPSDSILVSSFLTFCRYGTATLLGVLRAPRTGVWLDLDLVLCTILA